MDLSKLLVDSSAVLVDSSTFLLEGSLQDSLALERDLISVVRFRFASISIRVTATLR